MQLATATYCGVQPELSFSGVSSPRPAEKENNNGSGKLLPFFHRAAGRDLNRVPGGRDESNNDARVVLMVIAVCLICSPLKF